MAISLMQTFIISFLFSSCNPIKLSFIFFNLHLICDSMALLNICLFFKLNSIVLVFLSKLKAITNFFPPSLPLTSISFSIRLFSISGSEKDGQRQL